MSREYDRHKNYHNHRDSPRYSQSKNDKYQNSDKNNNSSSFYNSESKHEKGEILNEQKRRSRGNSNEADRSDCCSIIISPHIPLGKGIWKSKFFDKFLNIYIPLPL